MRTRACCVLVGPVEEGGLAVGPCCIVRELVQYCVD